MSLSWWPFLVFGAPGAVLALVVSGIGVTVSRPSLLVLGHLLAWPSALYLGAHPGAWPAMVILPLTPLLSAIALYNKKRLLAIVLLLPNTLAATYLTLVSMRNLGDLIGGPSLG